MNLRITKHPARKWKPYEVQHDVPLGTVVMWFHTPGEVANYLAQLTMERRAWS